MKTQQHYIKNEDTNRYNKINTEDIVYDVLYGNPNSDRKKEEEYYSYIQCTINSTIRMFMMVLKELDKKSKIPIIIKNSITL